MHKNRKPGVWLDAFESNAGHMSFMIGNPYGQGLFD